MDNEKPKKKGKKAAADGDGGKEHKKPWQEEYATMREIRQMLSDNVFLRHNVIIGRPEFRVPMRDEFDAASRIYYPKGSEVGEFVSSAEILQTISYNLYRDITPNKMGRAMTALGFKRERSHNIWGYRVVAYSPDEIRNNKTLLAHDACSEAKEEPYGSESSGNSELF